ncbi:MAG: hypothetical protein QM755_02270 [Luteolibacter sp.]
MRSRLSVLFLLTACILPLRAHTLRFVAFDFPMSVGACKITASGKDAAKEAKQIELGINRFSAPLELPPGPYQFALPDGKTAELTLTGDAAGKVLVIVLPGSQGKVALVQVPDQAAAFGAGDRVFINATKVPVRIQLGTVPISCPAGGNKVVKALPKSADGRIPVRMWYARGEEWLKFNSTYWPDNQAVRSMVLIFPNPEIEAPGVKTIEEVPPAERSEP